jgi:hypothetical protein
MRWQKYVGCRLASLMMLAVEGNLINQLLQGSYDLATFAAGPPKSQGCLFRIALR